ncbi:MAG: aromatic amino acid transaminase [Erythrobacter sp.]|jgi:aromatic-amino-acid transaminase|nr:aromatic amino acid transaminase [Erythrobacter sp.]
MLNRLEPQQPDALLALIKLHAADDRPDTIDLGVGVYRTDEGATPVFRAIKQAEAVLLETQDSKSYLGPEGDIGFVNALMPYVFGENATMGGRIAGMQTPGGTGGVRLALALAQKAGMQRLHLGTPSWPNHAQIIADLGLEMAPFDHANHNGTANLEAVLGVIRAAQPGDGILLHGCCHNPTGIDYSAEDWDMIGDAIAESGIFPIIDSAYQGLGQGLEDDAAGMRSVLAKVPEALIAYSCDKNFGMYRDRVGALYMLAKEPGDLDKVCSNANALARATWSMPPDHGAAAVRVILRDPQMTKVWLEELDEMRARMRAVRARLAKAGTAGAIDLTPLGSQNGLFSMLPVSKEQVATLREKHGIYMAGSGRINVAGLTMGNIDKFIAAVADVTAG